MLAAVVVAGLIIGSLLWAAVTDMFKDEARTRLDRLPYLLIRIAALRIPRIDRSDLIDEWVAELDFILSNTEGLPLTRLLRGLWFWVDLVLRGAPSVAKEIKATRVRPRGASFSDFLLYVIEDSERTSRLQVLISSFTNMVTVVIGSVGVIVMVALHQRHAAEACLALLALAAIVGIRRLVTRIWHRKKRDLST